LILSGRPQKEFLKMLKHTMINKKEKLVASQLLKSALIFGITIVAEVLLKKALQKLFHKK
jgi:hypothetical protein